MTAFLAIKDLFKKFFIFTYSGFNKYGCGKAIGYILAQKDDLKTEYIVECDS